jgi:hypothetical protein
MRVCTSRSVPTSVAAEDLLVDHVLAVAVSIVEGVRLTVPEVSCGKILRGPGHFISLARPRSSDGKARRLIYRHPSSV